MNTFILSQSGGSEGLGFAIPSNIIENVYTQLRELAMCAVVRSALPRRQSVPHWRRGCICPRIGVCW